MFLEDQIVSDIEKSDASQASPEIPIIQTFVSPPVVHNDYERAGEDNNDGTVEPALSVESELKKSTRER